jgi:hypothetical protein
MPLEDLALAFPAALRDEALRALPALVLGWREPSKSFFVRLDGETLAIPYRVYHAAAPVTDALPEIQRVIIQCLQTRHHDGRVRQENLEWILRTPHPWTVPFVVQLVGEYVLEILNVIDARLADIDTTAYGAFLVENPAYVELTRARVLSYWSAYFRPRYPQRESHVGFRLLATFDRACAAQRRNALGANGTAR